MVVVVVVVAAEVAEEAKRINSGEILCKFSEKLWKENTALREAYP